MITIKIDNDFANRRIIHSNLRKNNISKCEWMKNNISENVDVAVERYNNFLAFDDHELIGGACGFTRYNWYFLEILYVNKMYRDKDVGSNLLKEIEKFARENGLSGVRMETWSFQARGFYEKNGYTVFGELKDHPPGTTYYFLKKEMI